MLYEVITPPDVPPPTVSTVAWEAVPTPALPLGRLGYTTQVGAFSQLDNAVRLERLLKARGIDAYDFRHESGLCKVRFGNHDSYRAARADAERLRAQGP